MPRFLWLGNPENRRCQFFLEAAAQEGFPPPLVLSYESILYEQVDWPRLLSQVDGLRLESPGENARVAQGLLRWGAEHAALSSAVAPHYQLPKGSLKGLQQQHLGFMRLLEKLEKVLVDFPAVRLVNSLESIRCCFDKAQCHRRWQQKGISVPSAIYQVQSYDDLRVQLAVRGWTRVFIKPLHGSSASGVVAFRRQGERFLATTSVEMKEENGRLELYNSLRLRHYKKEKDIASLINRLAQEGILVEQWIPKASIDNAFFDLRMVVIGGQAQHVVVRQSQSPLTNLHLGNQRGSLTRVEERMGTAWASVKQLAQQAAAALPPQQYASLDVLIRADWKKAYLLEANAFGDLLPRILYQGRDTYAAVLHHLNQQ